MLQGHSIGEGNLITSLRRHTLCRCAEVYYLCEGQLANTAATSQEREVGKNAADSQSRTFFPLLSSTDWATSCILRCFFFLPPSPLFAHSWIPCSKESFCLVVDSGKVCMVPVLWHYCVSQLARREDPEAIYYLPWPFLTLSLLLSPQCVLTDRKSKQNSYESTNLTWVHGMYRCELKKKCVGFRSSGVGSPSDIALTKRATCDWSKRRASYCLGTVKDDLSLTLSCLVEKMFYINCTHL